MNHTAATALRRGAIFATIAGAGFLLVRLLAAPSPGDDLDRPRVDVDSRLDSDNPGPRVPPTDPSHMLGHGRRIETRSVTEVKLDDGTVVAFEEALLWGASWETLPRGEDDLQRMRIVSPVVHLRERPRTQADLSRAAKPSTTVKAERGLLERGPDGLARILLEGAVESVRLREDVPWTFRADTATLDLESSILTAPGEVRVESDGVDIVGFDLRASNAERTVTLASRTSGTLRDPGGVRLGSGTPDEPLHFRCTGPFLLIDGDPKAAADSARTEIRLREETRISQGDGTVEADAVDLLLRRRSNADEAAKDARPATLESVEATGSVRLNAGKNLPGEDGLRRSLFATGDRLSARPLPDGRTEATLHGNPRVRLEERRAEVTVSVVEISSAEPARILSAAEGGNIEARFPGGAVGTQRIPGQGPDGADRVRELTSRELVLVGTPGKEEGVDGSAGRSFRLAELQASQEARFREGDRTASADRIRFEPLPDGGARVHADGNVVVELPSTGGLDPLGPMASGSDDVPQEAGSMLLRSPGSVLFEAPRAGGGVLVVEGGALVRRVVGEREIWSLSATLLQVDLKADRGGVELLDARGGARLAGKGEGAGARSYDFLGDRIVVRNTGLSDRPDSARLDGAPARATLSGDDGRPLVLEAPVLHFDRTTGAFLAEGPVHARGAIADNAASLGPKGEADRSVTLEAGALTGNLEMGAVEGRSRLLNLRASKGVKIRSALETAEGETLLHDARTGATTLTGAPARVTSVTSVYEAAGKLVDLCEAPEFALRIANGEISAAGAPGGGRFTRHRVAPPGDTDAPPVERLQVRCDGPITYGDGQATLQENVEAHNFIWKDLAFVERESFRGADAVNAVFGKGGTAGHGLISAIATSTTGKLHGRSDVGGWEVSLVGKATIDAGRSLVRFEALPGERLMASLAGTTHQYRSVIYDYAQEIFREMVGGTTIGR